MADLTKRAVGGGVSIKVVDGKVTIYANPALLAASHDLSAIGDIPLVTFDVAKLEQDSVAEGGRFWRRVKGWLKRKK